MWASVTNALMWQEYGYGKLQLFKKDEVSCLLMNATYDPECVRKPIIHYRSRTVFGNLPAIEKLSARVASSLW